MHLACVLHVYSILLRYWGVIGGVGLFFLCYTILVVIWIGCDRYDWDWAYETSVFIAKRYVNRPSQTLDSLSDAYKHVFGKKRCVLEGPFVLHCGPQQKKKHRKNSLLVIHFSTSEGMSEASI